MFQHHRHHPDTEPAIDRGRRRHRGSHDDLAHEVRSELRRHLHRGGRGDGALGDLLRRGRFGPAVRRGEIRGHILGVLKNKPMHGYEIIQHFEDASGGRWRPSAGSVYPTLQQLADEGLLTSEEVDGRRTYTLTAAGRKAAAGSSPRSPWSDDDGEADAQVPDIRGLAAAAIQVYKVGSPQARAEANRILVDARRQLYRLLSEDELVGPADPEEDGGPRATAHGEPDLDHGAKSR